MQDSKNNQEVTVTDVMEFLKEHMVMNADFDDLRGNFHDLKGNFEDLKKTVAMKDDLKELATKKDVERLDARLGAIQLEIEDIKTRLDKIEKTLKEDTDALAMEVVSLKKRVGALEQQLGMQRMAVHA